MISARSFHMTMLYLTNYNWLLHTFWKWPAYSGTWKGQRIPKECW